MSTHPVDEFGQGGGEGALVCVVNGLLHLGVDDVEVSELTLGHLPLALTNNPNDHQ